MVFFMQKIAGYFLISTDVRLLLSIGIFMEYLRLIMQDKASV